MAGGSLASQRKGGSTVIQALAGAALVSMIIAASGVILAEEGRMLDAYVALSDVVSSKLLEELSVEKASSGVVVRNVGAVEANVAYALVKMSNGTSIVDVGTKLRPGEELKLAVPVPNDGVIIVTSRGNVFAASSSLSPVRAYGSDWVFGESTGSTAVRLFANPWNLTYIYVVEGEETMVHILNGTSLEVLDSFLPPPHFEHEVKLSSGRLVRIGIERVVPSLDHRYAYLVSTDGAVAAYDTKLKDYIAAWESPNPTGCKWLHWNTATYSFSQPFDAGTEVLYAATVGSRLVLAVHVYEPYIYAGPGGPYPAYHHYYRLYTYDLGSSRRMLIDGAYPFAGFTWFNGTEVRASTSDKVFAIVTDNRWEVCSYGVPASGNFYVSDPLDAYYRKWGVAWVEGGSAKYYEFRANYTDLPWWGFSANYSYRVFKRWIVVTSTNNVWESTSKRTPWGTYYTWLLQSFTVPSSLGGWNVSCVDAVLYKYTNPTYGTMCIYTLSRQYNPSSGTYDYYLGSQLEATTAYTTYLESVPGVGSVQWVRFYFSNNTKLSQTSWDSYAVVWKPDGTNYPYYNAWYLTQSDVYGGGKAWEKVAEGYDPYGGMLLAPDGGQYDFWIKIHLVNERGETATVTVQVTPTGSFGYAEAKTTPTVSAASDELIEKMSVEMTFPSYLPLLSHSSQFSASGTVSESLVAVNSTHIKYAATWVGNANFGASISATLQETQGWLPVSKSYGSGVKATFVFGDRLAAITAGAAYIYDVADDTLLASTPLNGSFPAIFQPTGHSYAFSSAGFYLCEVSYVELFDWSGNKLLTVNAADFRLYREFVPSIVTSVALRAVYLLSYEGSGVRLVRVAP